MKYLKYIDANVESQKGKVFVVTGATSGIGLEVSKQLAYKGAKVIMAVRNLAKANKIKEGILKEVKDADLEIMKFDQADFSSIEEFAKTISNMKIDCLIMNAGIFHPTNNTLTNDGYPLTIGTNYIGAFYLAKKLESSFKNGNIKRVVVTSSIVHVIGNTKHYEKYLTQVKKKPNRTYNISKQMNYHFAGNLKSEFPNLEVVLTHPGMARTNIIKADSSSFKWWFKVLGDRFMKIFANSAEKSAISTLLASTIVASSEISYVYPRGIFHCVGYPHISEKKIDKIKDDKLNAISNKIIAS